MIIFSFSKFSNDKSKEYVCSRTEDEIAYGLKSRWMLFDCPVTSTPPSQNNRVIRAVDKNFLKKGRDNRQYKLTNRFWNKNLIFIDTVELRLNSAITAGELVWSSSLSYARFDGWPASGMDGRKRVYGEREWFFLINDSPRWRPKSHVWYPQGSWTREYFLEGSILVGCVPKWAKEIARVWLS